MGLYTTVYRASAGFSRLSSSKFIALGIWVIACILVYDKLMQNAGSVARIGMDLRSAANDMLVIEKVTPFVPHRPFDQNHPKMVLMLAYQRVGSTFCGQIFNQNPDDFYLYEPVDGIYSAMYGTEEGYAVPSDIAYYWNGTTREMPAIEQESIAEILGALLTCDFDNVPTEVLIHRFHSMFKINQRRLAHFANCIREKGLNLEKCQKNIRNICPKRFGANVWQEDYCREALWLRNTKQIKAEHVTSFEKYQTCMYEMRRKLSACMPLMQDVCAKSNVRTTKTVRVNMATVEYIFRHFTNFRVVHLIRDPRAVALSRFGHTSFRGKNSNNLQQEAALYCHEVVQDIKIRNQIEERFPGSVMQVIYEQIVTNPMEQIAGIYSFLNESMPRVVEQWLQKNTDGAVRNSSKIAEKWQNKLTYRVAKQVSDSCSDLYNAVNYRWPG